MAAQRIPIGPSTRLAALLCAVHFAAAGAVWAAPLPLWLQAAASLAVAASLVFAIAQGAALHAAGAAVALEIGDGDEIALHTRRGERLECRVLGSSFVSAHLTVLNLKPLAGGRAHHVVLMADSMDEQELRRLRVWLRWGRRRSDRAVAPPTPPQ